MAKDTKVWVCDHCGERYQIIKPVGPCRSCGEFTTYSSIQEEQQTSSKQTRATTPTKKPYTIKELSNAPIKRTKTGISELDRVLGGGMVDAEVVLLSGSPGAGKSSLALEVANNYAVAGAKVLYVSGEESEHQIGLRARRMQVDSDNIRITNTTSLEALLGHIEREEADLVIVDSLQTMASSAVRGSIGSISQSKEVAHTLTAIAKRDDIAMILISQVVKSGDFSGSESIQHIVDATLMLDTDKDSPLKFLRATKNRFGDTNEVGVFQHTDKGLKEVLDPSGVLLDDDNDTDSLPGIAMTFISEGVRQIPVEIQSLVAETPAANPRRQFAGVSYNRGQIVCAILDKFCSTKLFDYDVFVNTISGIRIVDPMADLACAAAIWSSLEGKPVSHDTMFVGELSLTGQVRGTFMAYAKVREAERLGFKRIVVPKSSMRELKSYRGNIEICPISRVKQLKSFINNDID